MVFRAIVCCAALIVGLLATLGASAQSAEKARPLDLMSFMRGGAKTAAAKPSAGKTDGQAVAKTAAVKATKHRRSANRSAPRTDNVPETALQPEPAVLPAAAAAYASHDDKDVQVVASDELNAIDLAMLRETPETVGAAQKTDGTDSDVSVRVASADAAPKPDAAAARNTEAPSDDSRDNSWMDRLWSAVGDGFVALFAMLR